MGQNVNQVKKKNEIFLNSSTFQWLGTPKLPIYALKSSICNVEMQNLIKNVDFRKNIFGMKHPNHRVFQIHQI